MNRLRVTFYQIKQKYLMLVSENPYMNRMSLPVELLLLIKDSQFAVKGIQAKSQGWTLPGCYFNLHGMRL